MDIIFHINPAMRVTVSKWGNSLAIRIPNPLVKGFRLKEGDVLSVIEKDGGFVARPEPTADLASVLAAISPQSLHAGTEWGPSVGSEKLPAYE